MDTCQYTLSVEIPYGLTIVSSSNYDHDYCFKLGKTMISGKFVEYHDNGRKAWEVNYMNCKREGLSVGWWDGGNKHWIENYIVGREDGLSIGWYNNGNKAYEINYKNGEKDGLSTLWWYNGKKTNEINYKNGKPIEEKRYE